MITRDKLAERSRGERALVPMQGAVETPTTLPTTTGKKSEKIFTSFRSTSIRSTHERPHSKTPSFPASFSRFFPPEAR